MNPRLNKSVTLLELLIAIALLSVIVIGFTSIDIFSRYHVLTSDRRAKLQNEVSYALEHMTKEISKAIGSRIIPGQDPIDLSPIGTDPAIRVYVDLAADGQSAGDGQRGTEGDRWRAYRYRSNTAPVNDRYQIWYYANCVGPNCNQTGSIGPEIIAQKISSPFISSVTDNYVTIALTACWDPAQSATCGTPDNPSVTMPTRIKMPSVSTN